MTKEELMTLFIDFWPALKCWGDQEIEDDRLIECWSRHISGKPYTLPEGFNSRVTIHPKTKG